MSLLDDLADRWAPEPNTGCYLWLGSVVGRNRPCIKRRGVTKKVARLVCEEVYGSPPTEKHEAAHSTPIGCCGGLCISPAHLRWATRSENQQDISAESRSERTRKARMAVPIEQRSGSAFRAVMRLTPEQRKERSRKMHEARYN